MSEERLTLFGRALRDAGLNVGTGRIADFCRAAALLPPDDLYWAGRATLVSRAADIPAYDETFERFFGPPAEIRPQPAVVRIRVEGEAETALASPVELLREKSFARCSEAELAALGELMRRLPLVVPERRSRRRVAARAGAPDLRRTLRRSFRTGGEPVERAWRERRRVRRPLVLLGDVNEWFPAASALRRLHARFGRGRGVRTFPSRRPLLALDRVWVQPRAALTAVHAHRSPLARVASDHLPLRATVLWSPAAG